MTTTRATLIALLLMTTASGAWAADSAAADAAADSGEIIVRGQKADRTLQDTPASVGVTTAEAITAQSLISVYDVLERTPNLAVDGNKTTFSIRGIDAFNVSGAGDGALASVYLDGAVLPKTALTAGPLDLYDIDQVEVFRGPQSTVQGRNALAGAVIIRTTDPGYVWSGRARLLITDKDGQRRAAAAVGGPIVADQIAFRLAGEIARADGLIYNQTLHMRGDRRASETIRGKLLLTPTALPGLRIVASYMHDRHKRGTFYSEFSPPYDMRDRIATEDVPDWQTVKSDIATLEASYDFGRGLSLNAVTNYSKVTWTSVVDPDRSATPGQTSRTTDPSKTFQQELRLNVDWSWVKGLVGAYYLRDDNRGYYFDAAQTLNLTRLGVDRTLMAAPFNLPQSVVNTVLGLYGGSVAIRNSLSQPRLTHNHAAFLDLTFPIVAGLKINAGLRYDRETQERGATQNVVVTQTLPNPATLPSSLSLIVTQLNAVLLNYAANSNTVQPVREVKYEAWLPKLGLTYAFTRDLSLSFTFQRGYRAGGSGLNQQRGQYYEYNPEHTSNYELALRSQWFDRKLTINANAYRIDWTDQQVTVQLTPGAVFDSQVINAGKSRLWGFEVEAFAHPTRTLDLYAGVGYTGTRFVDFAITVGTQQAGGTGNQFARAPHWTASTGATWRHPSGLFANLNANFRSAYYQSTSDQPYKDIGSRTLVNTRLGWQGEHVGAFVTVTNIFDVQKPTQFFADFDGRTRGVLSEPRTVGISFEGRF